MDVERRLRELGGAASPGQLGTSSAARRAIARLVAEGAATRDELGCVAVPGTDADIIRARQLGARLTCVSAAAAHGFSVLDGPHDTHLAVPHRRGPGLRSGAGPLPVVVHREVPALLAASPHPGVPGGGGPLVVEPAESLARMLRCMPDVVAIAAIDSALNRRACTAPEIAALLTGPGSPRARATLAECDGRSVSAPESAARVALRRAGLEVEPNALVEGVGYVDLLVAGRVVVECDGLAYHSSRRALTEDRRRDRELQLQGFVVLRFPAEEVLADPAGVVRAVQRALRRQR